MFLFGELGPGCWLRRAASSSRWYRIFYPINEPFYVLGKGFTLKGPKYRDNAASFQKIPSFHFISVKKSVKPRSGPLLPHSSLAGVWEVNWVSPTKGGPKMDCLAAQWYIRKFWTAWSMLGADLLMMDLALPLHHPILLNWSCIIYSFQLYHVLKMLELFGNLTLKGD